MTIHFDEITQIKTVLSPLLDDCSFEEAGHGESGARVLQVGLPGGDLAFLKYAFGTFGREIRDEYERISWLQPRALTPEVMAFAESPAVTVLLTKALPGRNAADASNPDPQTLVAGMARALRELHSLPPKDCPFDASWRLRLQQALARLDAGLVDEDDFDEARQGMRAHDVYEQLRQRPPEAEQFVVTHGDACPENIVFQGNALVGFIDCGRLGLADKYQDLALASRNIHAVFGPELADRFFVEYGEPKPDLMKLDFYWALDEFF